MTANKIGVHEIWTGDSNDDFTTVAVSSHAGTIIPSLGFTVLSKTAGTRSTTAVPPAAKNGFRNVENINATVPANAEAAARHTINNHTSRI